MNERIPQAELDAACLRMCRRFAAALVKAMAETDASFEAMDAKLGAKPGHCWRALQQLIHGKTKRLDDISDLALAMECDIQIQIHLRHSAEPPVVVPSEASAEVAP